MIINHNISSMNALRNLNINSSAMSKTMERLSSGYRINRAADDAAGLAISEKMRAQISGLRQAQRNAQDGISLIQTAEGALNEVHSMLRRIRDLAVQASNGTYTDADKAEIQKEVKNLIGEISGIAVRTEFNTMKLLNFTGVTSTFTFQVGANDEQTISIDLKDMRPKSLAIKDFTVSGTSITLKTIDDAISVVSSFRSDLGAVQNRLEHTINNLAVSEENLQAAESRIRDADMAAEVAELTKAQILQQAGTAMLAQANMKSQSVLSLLG
ncbi:MAG TPA: flagellin [Halanaerobiales bacterium]|nr:flagellin [Halanaerobiales bacterium]